MTVPKRKKRRLSQKEQRAVIDRQNRSMQIDLRKAVFPQTLLFFFKKRPHYAREIEDKIRTFIGLVANFFEGQMEMSPIFNRSLKVQKNLVYRNLLKLEQQGILGSYKEKSALGPERKYYFLTEFGNVFFNEVVEHGLLPRIFFLYSFMDFGTGGWSGKNRFSKEGERKFHQLLEQLVE